MADILAAIHMICGKCLTEIYLMGFKPLLQRESKYRLFHYQR